MPHKTENKAAHEINQEIGSVYEYCLAAGLTHEEIVEKAGPLLRPLVKEEWKKTLMTLVKIGICCLAVSYTLSSDMVARSFLSKSRQLMFKVLAVWDWTELYYESCLMDNPLYQNEQVYVIDCQACEDLFEVEYLNSSSAEEISEVYMQRNLPVIVRDAMVEWPIMQDSFTILNLTHGFHKLKDGVCMLQSNLNVDSHQKVFQKLLMQGLNKWYAHWENCEKATQKLMRTFYSRPYFIPNIVQMTESNWLLMSSGYKGKKLKTLDVLPSVTAMWIAQVWGYNRIQLQPKKPCIHVCNPLESTLEEGEIVLFNPAVWTFSYLPGEGTENLAIAAGGFSHFS